MPRAIHRLSARTVQTIGVPGRHADGGGLYLSVSEGGRRRWVFLYRWHGKPRELGLGAATTVSLKEARALADEARRMVKSGKDPIAERRVTAPSVPTFGAMADEVIAALSPQFRNDKHVAQWRMTLSHYAAPMRAKPVDEITTEDVLGVLKSLWVKRPETASRLRGRIERVLDAARAKGHRNGENPARWRGHLDSLLPKRQKLTRGHHAAMAYADLPAFVELLRQGDSVSALALEFTILTAARSGETRGATWGEIDLAGRLWTVPASRMKAAREHRVPLCACAVEILETVRRLHPPTPAPWDFVFPGARRGKPLSVMAMDMLLRRLSQPVTVHGFRSSFRDWCGEETDFSREVAEAALAHTIGDAVERAYRRGDALEKRRLLMDVWGRFCASKCDPAASAGPAKGVSDV